MTTNVLIQLEGKDAWIASRVCVEWKILLEKQTQKYLINKFLEKLEKLVAKYSDCKVYIILGNRPEAELIEQKNVAEKKVNDFFEERNKNYDKKLYIKAIKAIVRYDLFDYLSNYNMKDYANWVYSESFITKFNSLRKQL